MSRDEFTSVRDWLRMQELDRMIREEEKPEPSRFGPAPGSKHSVPHKHWKKLRLEATAAKMREKYTAYRRLKKASGA